MSDITNLSLVMGSIEASNRVNLILLQKYTNEINGRAFNYQSPMKDGSKWIVWLYFDPTRDKLPTEKQMLQAFKSEAI